MYIQLGIPLLESILYQNIELYMEIKFEIFFSSVKLNLFPLQAHDVVSMSIQRPKRSNDVAWMSKQRRVRTGI